ncbi:hypothetical protein MKX03_003918, partial [Papaver bracteatum]
QYLITILYEKHTKSTLLRRPMVVQQPKTFVVMVDNTLMSWSKGRMHATKHR